MRIFSFLEKKNIVTKETFWMLVATFFFCYLSWVFVEPKHLSSFPISYISKQVWIIISVTADLLFIKPIYFSRLLSLSIFLMAVGGIANLTVVYANNRCMPVSAKNRKEFLLLEKLNPKRRLSMLNKQTKLGCLCDRFNVGKDFYSIGDFIVDLGVIIIASLFLAAVVIAFQMIRTT